MAEYIVLAQTHEKYAPADLPVLKLAVVGNELFLSICQHEQTHDTETLRDIASVNVPVTEIFAAITDLYTSWLERQCGRVLAKAAENKAAEKADKDDRQV